MIMILFAVGKVGKTNIKKSKNTKSDPHLMPVYILCGRCAPAADSVQKGSLEIVSPSVFEREGGGGVREFQMGWIGRSTPRQTEKTMDMIRIFQLLQHLHPIWSLHGRCLRFYERKLSLSFKRISSKYFNISCFSS